MSGFLADFDAVLVQATTTTSNVALSTSGPGTFYVSNTGTVPVKVALTQDGSNLANVVIPGGWPQIVQIQNPERVPGTVYALVTAVSSTANVYITSGFEV
jgi:hypothetical protein